LTVAIPSKLILPSNVTLVEQGKMLTRRGEHFYLTVNNRVTVVSCRALLPRAMPEVQEGVTNGTVGGISYGTGILGSAALSLAKNSDGSPVDRLRSECE